MVLDIDGLNLNGQFNGLIQVQIMYLFILSIIANLNIKYIMQNRMLFIANNFSDTYSFVYVIRFVIGNNQWS